MEASAVETCRNSLKTNRSNASGFLFRMLSGGRREALFWSLQTLFWVFLGIVGLLMTHAFRSEAPDVERAIFVRMASGFVLSAGLRGVYRLPFFRQRRGLVKWALAAGCCMAFALVEALVLQGLALTGISLPGGGETVGLKLLLVRVFVLSLWSTLYFFVHLVEAEHALELRATKAELSAREQELRRLQVQMMPYFVFNALDAVIACKDDPEAVQEVTRSLAEYLKFSLQESRPLEPLSRELDALEKFLTAQTSRFGENMVCRIHCESAARKVMVPPMMIQPLLEDAFHHRSRSLDLPLQIWLTAHMEDGFLEVTLSSTGEAEFSETGESSSGSGIQALRQRLNLLLGPRAQVERQTEDGWIRVTVHIPLER